ncbi:MAG: hypothetical protein RMK75_02235 [Aquificaceae bacterium]|nr:hypothetical protein [Aquificaceae bacterium]MDW8423128.1 hypothetical protein [Aquificaceae bacterium]
MLKTRPDKAFKKVALTGFNPTVWGCDHVESGGNPPTESSRKFLKILRKKPTKTQATHRTTIRISKKLSRTIHITEFS